jgi:hypothetical protein
METSCPGKEEINEGGQAGAGKEVENKVRGYVFDLLGTLLCSSTRRNEGKSWSF